MEDIKILTSIALSKHRDDSNASRNIDLKDKFLDNWINNIQKNAFRRAGQNHCLLLHPVILTHK
jgi:hypothetical protein